MPPKNNNTQIANSIPPWSFLHSHIAMLSLNLT